MTMHQSRAGWLRAMHRTLCTDVAADAAGRALNCDDTTRLAVAMAGAGAAYPSVRLWLEHLAWCPLMHAPPPRLDALPGPVTVQQADALIRELMRPVALAAVASTLACDGVDLAVTAVHHLDRLTPLPGLLLAAHAPRCTGPHQDVTDWTTAGQAVLEAVQRVTGTP